MGNVVDRRPARDCSCLAVILTTIFNTLILPYSDTSRMSRSARYASPTGENGEEEGERAHGAHGDVRRPRRRLAGLCPMGGMVGGDGGALWAHRAPLRPPGGARAGPALRARPPRPHRAQE